MASYSEYYKRRMQAKFDSSESNKNSPFKKSPGAKIKRGIMDIHEKAHKTGARGYKDILIVLIIVFLVSICGLLFYILENPAKTMFILITGLGIGFFILFLLHRLYEKSLNKASRETILFFVYLLLMINMYLGIKVYSIEWAFLGFIIAIVIFYDAKIDSRFLILPALLLLGYVPFLLIAKFNSLAETIAIYVYYFLVSGVGLQLIEHMKEINNSLDFGEWIKKKLEKTNWIGYVVFFGIASILLIVLNRIKPVEIWKWTSVYVFVVFLALYFISTMKEEDKYDK
ncbi:MAG: hypothetical protein AABX54_03715 [Nanoarchaeota archaeon]